MISTSYGYNEADLTRFYTARQCAEYAKLGLQGVTVVYSSGDNGVAGNGGNCLNDDGESHGGGWNKLLLTYRNFHRLPKQRCQALQPFLPVNMPLGHLYWRNNAEAQCNCVRAAP